MHNLSESDIKILTTLNECLWRVQDLLMYKLQKVNHELASYVNVSNNDNLDDYEIGVEIQYILRDTDSSYRKDEDNILTMRNGNWNYQDLNTVDWAGSSSYLRMISNQCWLFHELYHHEYQEYSPLPVEDLLRIGSVRVEFKPRHQYIFDVYMRNCHD
jgi:hypothetical protein